MFMRLKDLYIFLFFIFIFPAALQAQSVIYGLISDTTGISVDLANIAILNSRTGTMSQADGSYELEVPSDTPLEITISCIGFLPQTTEIMLKKGQRKKIDFVLVQDVRSLDPVSVSARQDQGTTFQRFDVRNLDYMMSTSSKVEDIIKSQAGVSANNELTSQYSVRGGNFDENLVYVNDIEIYRPFLVRSGQQEGLSFINISLT